MLSEDGAAAPAGFMAPSVNVFKAVIGDDFIIETRRNCIRDQTKLTGPVFSQFDQDGDGTIDSTEFGNYLET